MQLKNPGKIREILSATSCTLLATSPQQVHAGDDWKLEAGVLNYAEKDRVTVVEPAITGKRSLGDDESLNVRLVYDTMSGASPNGATATDKPQSFTTASGQSQYTVPANELPMRKFSDDRFAGSLDWEKPLSRYLRAILGANLSSESDYSSFGLSSTFTLDLNNRLTTLTAGAALNADQVQVRGKFPVGLAQIPPYSPSAQGGGEEEGGEEEAMDSKSKNLADFLVGVTQVLSRRALTQLNYGYGLSNGYLTDPYKMLSVVDGSTGETLDYRFEKRPDSRTRQTLLWKTVYHFPADVLHFTYRYYWDDWDIQAHTFDLNYRFELGKGAYLAPHLRYYSQTAAGFYRHSLIDGQALPQFASADYRLAEMKSKTYGLKLGMPVDRRSEWALRAEYMQQTGNSHPNDAIGVQRAQDLYPGLEAYIFSLTFTTKF